MLNTNDLSPPLGREMPGFCLGVSPERSSLFLFTGVFGAGVPFFLPRG